MQISVIIPALNEAAVIARAIDAAWQAGADEVIVVDGGSGDESREIAAAARCHLICSEPGRGRQQNAGSQAATGDVLLFLHADNWLASAAIDQIRQTLAEPRVLHGAFRQRIEHASRRFRWLEAGNAARVRLFGLPYGDQGIFVRRDVFFEIGGFPDIPLMEDVALMRKLRRRARPVLLDGPLHVSPRRWLKHGVIRQTLRNWSLLAGYTLGVPPARLARCYRRHDQK